MHPLRLALLVAAAAALVACAQVSRTGAPVSSARPQPVTSVPRASGLSENAQAGNALPGPAASAPTAFGPAAPPRTPAVAAAIPVPPPSPAAVAAHFPEPAATFETPAFQRGRTDFTHSDEVRDLLQRAVVEAAEARRQTDARLVEIGISQGGEPILALSLTRPTPLVAPRPAAEASGAAASLPAKRPTVLLLAGQHGDEPAGTEALLVLARALAQGRHAGVLDRVDVVVVPLANPDGRALFQRDTADGTDLNRDHLLLRTPEAQAVAQLIVAVDPLVVADFHEYPVDGAFAARFGALPRFDVLLQSATTGNLPPFVSRAAEEWFRRPLAKRLAAAGFATEWYHTVSDDAGDRRVSMGGASAGIARNAFGLRNAVSLLVETRGGGIGRVDLKRRVQAALTAATDILEGAASRAVDLQKLRDFVDRDVAGSACRGEATIEAAPTPSEYALAMIDPVSGEIRRRTVSWDSALELRAVRMRPRPCGYWLAANQGDAVSRLRRLGVEVQQFDEAGDVRGETFREIGRESARADGALAADVGRPARLRVQTQPALVDAPAGSYFVSLDQPLANLAIAALEPDAPGSYAAAGLVTSVGGEARVLDRPRAKLSASP